MLTFEGANVDIYVGASAPLFAWLATRGRLGVKFALAWNVLGLLALTNVVIRAVLTAPGPFNLIHAEVPNLMMGAFPFMFIPAFFVPLAVVLRVLAISAIRSRLRTATRVIGPNPQTVPHSDLIFCQLRASVRRRTLQPVGPRWKKLAHRKIQEVEGSIQRARCLKLLLEHLLHCRCVSLRVCVQRLRISTNMRLIEHRAASVRGL
jgi:hypothetical protein